MLVSEKKIIDFEYINDGLILSDYIELFKETKTKNKKFSIR